MKLGLALLRMIVGGLFVGHGTQKLAGWFGGHGIEGTGAFFESLGLRPGRRHAVAAGVSETAGGALLALGLLTPVGASMISGAMLTAIKTVHLEKGPWVSSGGYEYNLTLLAVVFALADLGPGEWSLDEALGLRLNGPLWALAQLGAAGAGSALTIASAAKAAGPGEGPTSGQDGGSPTSVADPASPQGASA